MKYAIVEICGRQLWVETGKYYDLNRIPAELGQELIFNRILFLRDNSKTRTGQPYLSKAEAEVKGTILEHLRGKKVIVYKMRPKKKTRKKQGHRQELTRVLIKHIKIK